MILSTICSLVGLVGFIFVFTNPIITIVCAIVTLVDSFINVVWGEQKNFTTEILSAVLGIIIAAIAGAPWYIGIFAALCLGSFLFWLGGIIYILIVSKRF